LVVARHPRRQPKSPCCFTGSLAEEGIGSDVLVVSTRAGLGRGGRGQSDCLSRPLRS
jgi:hypothetical protein